MLIDPDLNPIIRPDNGDYDVIDERTHSNSDRVSNNIYYSVGPPVNPDDGGGTTPDADNHDDDDVVSDQETRVKETGFNSAAIDPASSQCHTPPDKDVADQSDEYNGGQPVVLYAVSAENNHHDAVS